VLLFGELDVKGVENDYCSINLKLLEGDFSKGLPDRKEDLLGKAFDFFT
jgi:hypothetical protein